MQKQDEIIDSKFNYLQRLKIENRVKNCALNSLYNNVIILYMLRFRVIGFVNKFSRQAVFILGKSSVHSVC